jgi:hypothetical protein
MLSTAPDGPRPASGSAQLFTKLATKDGYERPPPYMETIGGNEPQALPTERPRKCSRLEPGAFVPRFFFNVYDDVAIPDFEGTEFSDIYLAQAEAVRMSGEIMRDLGAKFWAGEDWRLEVTDAEGRKLYVIRFSAEEIG